MCATAGRATSSRARSPASTISRCPPSSRRGSSLPEDCLFCRLVREGDHVARTDGFVAVRDINPEAPTHLLVLPERHVESFRDVAEFPAEEAKRMLEFISDTARAIGVQDYKVLVNVGPGAGQTIFHLHWHLLSRETGGRG